LKTKVLRWIEAGGIETVPLGMALQSSAEEPALPAAAADVVALRDGALSRLEQAADYALAVGVVTTYLGSMGLLHLLGVVAWAFERGPGRFLRDRTAPASGVRQ
jgi:hypothetical protein